VSDDPIVAEVRKIRKEIEEEAQGDPDRYYEHLLELQEQYRSRLVRHSPKRLVKAKEKGKAG